MNPKTTFISLCILLSAGCESDVARENFDPENRRITEITGVEYYDGFEGAHYSRYCRHRFFYDDEGRLDRWTETTNTTETDLEFYYESNSRICIFGTETYSHSGETPIYTEIELDAAGRVIQIHDGNETTRNYTYSGGLLSERRYSGNDFVRTSSYTWTNGDLTQLDYRWSNYSYYEFFKIEYGIVPNIANLDLNYLSDYMDTIGSTERMLRIAGMLGRNAHLVTHHVTNYGTSSSSNSVIGEIEWTFDSFGYPTGWKSLFRDLGAPEKDTGWEYTIYYND